MFGVFLLFVPCLFLILFVPFLKYFCRTFPCSLSISFNGMFGILLLFLVFSVIFLNCMLRIALSFSSVFYHFSLLCLWTVVSISSSVFHFCWFLLFICFINFFSTVYHFSLLHIWHSFLLLPISFTNCLCSTNGISASNFSSVL